MEFDANTASYLATVFNTSVENIDVDEGKDFIEFIESVYEGESNENIS